MKTAHLLKLILTALPLVTLVYVFLLRDRLDSGDGIGGGSYDLTKMFTVIGVGIYLLVFNLLLLIQGSAENKFFLIAGATMLIIDMIIAGKIFS